MSQFFGGGGALRKFFESAEQAMTANATLTVAHGLGEVPKAVDIVLVNKTAEYGYAPGDILSIGAGGFGKGEETSGMAVFRDATNVAVRVHAAVKVIRFSDNTSNWRLTLASWRLVVRAWA